MSGETIAALATPPGRGGVAVVRVSGPDAFAIARTVTGMAPRVGRVSVRRFHADGVIDEGVVLAFGHPHSYTGEDVVEFQCHGGAVTPRRVLEACFAAGARLARRGEFTERAFLNGRLTYEQAASVLDLIDAKTVRAADAALSGLTGRRSRARRELYDALVDLSATVEHALDVDDGELPADFVPTLRRRFGELKARLAALLRTAHEGKILRDGALVVLAGPPNVGKSSLMNALLEENRVLVSDIPGTTRDSVEETLDLDGWPVRLVDTAGLRATDDPIEAAGVARSEKLLAAADVVLRLETCAEAKRDGDAAVAGEREIRVLTKCDVASAGTCAGIAVSARTGEGLVELKRAIVSSVEALASRNGDSSDGVGELDDLLRVKAQLEPVDALFPDLVLVGDALRRAAETLGARLGATYSDDMLDRLFSRFCVGK